MSDISLIPQNLIKGLESDLSSKTNEEWVNSRITSIMDSKITDIPDELGFILNKVGNKNYMIQFDYLPNVTGTITFKKPFTEVCFVFIGGLTQRTACSHDKELYPNTVTLTSFSYFNVFSSERGPFAYWVAIGY